MLRWHYVATALAIISLGVVLLLVSVFQNQRQLRSVQREFDRAKEQIVQSKAVTADLEKTVATIKTELNEAGRARREIQAKLDEANADNDQLRKELDAAQSQLK